MQGVVFSEEVVIVGGSMAVPESESKRYKG